MIDDKAELVITPQAGYSYIGHDDEKKTQIPDFAIQSDSKTVAVWEGKVAFERNCASTSRENAVFKTAEFLEQFCRQAISIFEAEHNCLSLHIFCNVGPYFSTLHFERKSFDGILQGSKPDNEKVNHPKQESGAAQRPPYSNSAELADMMGSEYNETSRMLVIPTIKYAVEHMTNNDIQSPMPSGQLLRALYETVCQNVNFQRKDPKDSFLSKLAKDSPYTPDPYFLVSDLQTCVVLFHYTIYR